MENKNNKQKKGRWNDHFAKPSYICGIISVATSLFMIGFFVGIPGIVFGALSSRTENPELKERQKKGLIMSIVGTVVGFISLIVWPIVIAFAIVG